MAIYFVYTNPALKLIISQTCYSPVSTLSTGSETLNLAVSNTLNTKDGSEGENHVKSFSVKLNTWPEADKLGFNIKNNRELHGQLPT
jgi:hypothetical protein